MLTFEDILEIERENDPLSADIYEMATKLYGKDALINPEQREQLNTYQQRADRLAPLRALQYGEAGSGRIAGNPYSIDTRGAMTGLSNLAVGFINRERGRRTQGDPKAVAKANERAETLRANLEALKAIENPDKNQVRDIESLERQIGRQTRRAERYGGFANEMNALRQLSEKETEREENIEDFIKRVAPQQAQAIFSDEVNRRSDVRITKRQEDTESLRHKNNIAEIEARGKEDRLTEEQRNRLRNDPNSPESRNIVFSELDRIMRLLNPRLELLPNEIQNLRMVERRLLSDGMLPGVDPELDQIQSEIKAREDLFVETSGDAVEVFIQARPELKGKIDFDDIIKRNFGKTRGGSGELDDL